MIKAEDFTATMQKTLVSATIAFKIVVESCQRRPDFIATAAVFGFVAATITATELSSIEGTVQWHQSKRNI